MTLIAATTAETSRELANAALRLLATDDDDYGKLAAARQEVARLARQVLKGVDLQKK